MSKKVFNKNSKQTEIGKIPEDWKLSTLDKLGDIHDNKRIPLSEMERANRKGKYPYCGANGVLDYIDDYIFDGEFILLAEDGGSYGKFETSCYIMNGKFWVNNHAHILQAIEGKTTNKFLLYSLQFLDLRPYIVGSTRVKLNQEYLRQIKIPCPAELREQKKIAEILSTVDEANEKVDKAIEKTERLKKGLMQELLTKGIGHKEFKDTEIGQIPKEWEMVKIYDLFNVETGTTPSTRKKAYWENGNVNWFTPTDLSELINEIYINESERKITNEAVKEVAMTVMPRKSLILSTRAPVGYIGVALNESTFNQGCKGLVPKDFSTIHPEYYCYYLQNKKYILQMQSGGSTFKELAKERIENFQVPKLYIEEQIKITKMIGIVDKHYELLQKKKNKYTAIKKQLMNDLLTGRKRVKI